MKRCRVRMVLAGAAVVVCAAPLTGAVGAVVVPAGVAVARADGWGRAFDVPGVNALNTGLDAAVTSVSCPSAGNCAAVGYYGDQPSLSAPNISRAFVVNERNGRWGTAMVPGSAARDKLNGAATQVSVSCSSAGNCLAGGFYAGSRFQAFLVSERNGRWRTAIQVPGSAAVNTGDATVTSVSCSSAGNCSAGGSYETRSHHQEALVVSERNGAWGTAIQVPGSAALNTGGNATVTSVSCPSAGNCAATGSYEDRSRRGQGFVVSERNGAWGKAIEVPGLGALNKGGKAQVGSMSCPSAGNCAAGGYYTSSPNARTGHTIEFVVSERNGRWGKAINAPGMAALNVGHFAQVLSLSCGSAGNCAAGGVYSDRSGNFQAFVVSKRNGAWLKAIEVPGSAALNTGGDAQIGAVSCPSAGNCAAGGSAVDYAHITGKLFVVSERNGAWGTAIEVRGLASDAERIVNSVSCSSAGHCVAGGSYDFLDSPDGPGFAFLVSEH